MNDPLSFLNGIRASMDYAKERSEIKCPYCGEDYDNEDYRFVTYHGEGDDSEGILECGECEKSFHVRERVSRYWDCTKVEDLSRK